MNCNQAFDLMTSRHGVCNAELHDHMDQCPRCREMRLTLEPALGAFRADALLHSPWEVMSDDREGSEIAVRAAQRLSAAESISNRSVMGLWGYAGAIVLGAGLVWATFMMNPSSLSMPEVHRGESTCLFQKRTRNSGMTGQQMTESCLACHSVPVGR